MFKLPDDMNQKISCHQVICLIGNLMVYKDLLLKLNVLRDLGKITACFESYEELAAIEETNLIHQIDNYIESLGFHKIDDNWLEISESNAHNTLHYLITHSIAYGTELMFSNELSEVVQEFMNLFLTNCRYFTNGNWYEISKTVNNSSVRLGPSWTPLSEATFDGGIVWISTKQVGIIWIEEND